MKSKTDLHFFELPIPTDDGDFLARYTDQGLAALNFPGTSPHHKNSTPPPPPQIQKWHRLTTQALADALAGRPTGELPPFDWSSGTEFQRRVWAAMNRIACGKTRSYSDIAAAIGKPKATRAVGGACGANPIPVLVPCHRVLAAHARLGGFSGGLDWKRTLLAREGVRFSTDVSRTEQRRRRDIVVA